MNLTLVVIELTVHRYTKNWDDPGIEANSIAETTALTFPNSRGVTQSVDIDFIIANA